MQTNSQQDAGTNSNKVQELNQDKVQELTQTSQELTHNKVHKNT
nr:hypothetical protein [Mycoplasmopsis bovis]